MDSLKYQSALLALSSKSDVKRGGGTVSITDLRAFEASKILDLERRSHRVEQSQIVVIDVTALTLVAEKAYTIIAGNTRNERESNQQFLKQYRVVSPEDITSTTFEDIIDSLVSKINATQGNFISAEKLTNKTFKITDDPGYYPARPASRVGPSAVKATDSLQPAVLTITVEGIVSRGIGARLIQDEPIIDNQTEDLIKGEYYAPTGAVSGQTYDEFKISYAVDASNNSLSGLKADKILRQVIFVDNGQGADASNLDGYNEFKREFGRLQAELSSGDPASLISFLDSPAIAHLLAGGLPLSADGSEGILDLHDAVLQSHMIGGTATLAFAYGDDGLSLDRGTPTNNQGLEISAPLSTHSAKQVIVGKQSATIKAVLQTADITKSIIILGLRKKADYDNLNDYTDLAAVGTDSGDNSVVDGIAILNNAATWREAGESISNAKTYELKVEVSIDGSVKGFVNGIEIDIFSAANTPMVFDADDILIPFIQQINDGGSDSDTRLKDLSFTVGSFGK